LRANLLDEPTAVAIARFPYRANERARRFVADFSKATASVETSTPVFSLRSDLIRRVGMSSWGQRPLPKQRGIRADVAPEMAPFGVTD
jgi:hypothetical protein